MAASPGCRTAAMVDRNLGPVHPDLATSGPPRHRDPTKSRSTTAVPGSGRDERSISSVSMISASACSSRSGPSARACAAIRARFGPKTGGRARASAASGPSPAQAAA